MAYNASEGMDNCPCPECGSRERLYDNREGDVLCPGCGLVTAQIIDDRDYRRTYMDLGCESGSTSGAARTGPSTALKGFCHLGRAVQAATKPLVTTSGAVVQQTHAQAWHASKRAMMSHTLGTLSPGHACEWLENAWGIYLLVVSSSRVPESLRDAMMAVSSFYATFMGAKNDWFSELDVQKCYGVDDADAEYDRAKKVARALLMETSLYRSVVIHDTEVASVSMRRTIRDVKAIGKANKHTVYLLACDLDAMRTSLNVLGSSRPSRLRPAILKIVCDAMGVAAALGDLESDKRGIKTVQKNIETIRAKVLHIWPSNNKGCGDVLNWVAHVARVMQKQK